MIGSGRVVVVTGSEGGIGQALVERFQANGDDVIGLDLLAGFDVTKPEIVRATFAEIAHTRGRIDVLCNNAGVGSVGDVVSSSDDEWQTVFEVNVFGLARTSAAVLPIMRAAGSGAIVNTCSVAAQVGLEDRAVYSASKGAVLALTRAMAADEVGSGVRVNCVCPGTVDGPWVQRIISQHDNPSDSYERLRRRQPLGRLITAEEVAMTVAYLADPLTHTTGQAMTVDGGTTALRIVK